MSYSSNARGSPNERFERAQSHHAAGQLDAAKRLYREILSENPGHAPSCQFLGVLAYQQGRYEDAIELLSRSLTLNAKDAACHSNLGLVFQAQGKLNEASVQYRQALQINPRYPEALNNLAIVLRRQGHLSEAIAHYRKALAINPRYPEALNGLGNAHKELGELDAAIIRFREALAIRSGDPMALNNLGHALQQQGKLNEGIACYQGALAIMPRFPEALNNLGNALGEQGNVDAAVASYLQAVAIRPEYSIAHSNLGIMLSVLGRFAEANRSCARSIELNPNSLAFRMNQVSLALPALYDSREEITQCRAEYANRLAAASHLHAASPREQVQDIEGVGNLNFFYLPYQAQNDRELQTNLGRLLCDAFAEHYRFIPSATAATTRVGSTECVHVGIVSHYFRDHSNWKIPIQGWIENIDRRRFRLSGYYTDNKNDESTVAARTRFDRFFQDSSLRNVCRAISEDRPDVLIYPGVGMDKASLHLAALRLAPVQCASWGHPSTTGMPSIDYFLSSELMETEQADAHYSEKLIRLPNLSIHYSPPTVAPEALDRRTLGLSEDGVLFFCPQSLQKYLPQHDELFVRIALQVPRAQFVFLSHHKCQRLTEQIQTRLLRAFSANSISASDRIVFLPRLTAAQFRAMSVIADICLDTPDWSGCNSSLELLECGLPIVTLPGEFMRGRHTYAILTMMGIDELIADSPEAYIELAVRLAQNSEWRESLRTKIIKSYPCVLRRSCSDSCAGGISGRSRSPFQRQTIRSLE